MVHAAENGNIENVRQCKDIDRAMAQAARGGHADIVRLCENWGAININ